MPRRWCIPLAGLALAVGVLAASAPAAASSHPAGHTIHLIRPAMHGTAPMAVRGRPSHALESPATVPRGPQPFWPWGRPL